MFVHVLPELLAAHLEDVPGSPGPRLHLFEHPPLDVVMEDPRDFRDHVPPHAFLEDLVTPMLQRHREAPLPVRIEAGFRSDRLQEIRDVVPHHGLAVPDQRGHVVLACRLDQLGLVVVRDVPGIEVHALEREDPICRDAVVADVVRVQEGTGGHWGGNPPSRFELCRAIRRSPLNSP